MWERDLIIYATVSDRWLNPEVGADDSDAGWEEILNDVRRAVEAIYHRHKPQQPDFTVDWHSDPTFEEKP